MADLLNTTKVVLTHVLETKSLPDVDLLKLLISQMLGYGVLLGSCITKLPQILLILQAGTAKGLSRETFEIETYALLISALYGYTRQLPFNTYGESAILAVQNLVILGLVYGYSRTPMSRRLAVITAYVALVVGVFTGHISPKTMTGFAEANTAVSVVSRLPQVVQNFANRSTGTLSGVTSFINVAGCVARIFTTIQAGGGPVMLRSYIVSLILNAMLVAQIWVYRKNTARMLREQREEQQAAAGKEQAGKEQQKQQQAGESKKEQ